MAELVALAEEKLRWGLVNTRDKAQRIEVLRLEKPDELKEAFSLEKLPPRVRIEKRKSKVRGASSRQAATPRARKPRKSGSRRKNA